MITRDDDSIYPTGDHNNIEPRPGLIKREFIAIAAMQGLCAGIKRIETPEDPTTIAKWAVSFADALMSELNQKVLTEDKGK